MVIKEIFLLKGKGKLQGHPLRWVKHVGTTLVSLKNILSTVVVDQRYEKILVNYYFAITCIVTNLNFFGQIP